MAFIKEIPLEEATGELREAYESDLKTLGYVANYTKVLALRPKVRAARGGLISAIRSPMDQPPLRVDHHRGRGAAAL